mmetsp:Transcript_24184/g.95227  ORF Transcript_24184/g.95227 Transcript_24184/m.95227 type:complete len:278 (-) Transcript_24184:1645-2478(-)|eukprot:CAMPEP_0113968322 /NCGR_PEP_ID=MMETSP0011_2-20120614/9465_1 /TAXON_ID=101924 /ORGANISM="Rhodosorus marinus" /LENGTH=277 /DNA_ID=CAMNT_0000981391 /DNA_START=214 /DNA_END=1044 /DNA_ORIENTATION=+ /assembly_acc=CAM_ASM_000156
MSLNLVADYGSSSEEEAPDLEEKRKDETKVVVVKALRQIGGSTISVVKDDEDLEEVKAKVVNDNPQPKTSRSKFNSFLPTPKNVESSVPRPTRKSESSETHKRKILHRDPFSIRRKVVQSEKILEPEGTPRHPAHMERSGESHAQDMERAEQRVHEEQTFAAGRSSTGELPPSVLKDLERDGIELDSNVIEVNQADHLNFRVQGAEETLRSQEQGYRQQRLASASTYGGLNSSLKTQKRKSQITSLAADLASRQVELEDKRNRGMRTKRETWAKYGW